MKDIYKIVRYSWSLKSYYIATFFFVVVISLLAQVTPFLLRGIIDSIVSHLQGSPLQTWLIIWLVVAIFAVSVATTLLSNIQGYIGDRLGVRLNTLLSQRYYDHLLTLPLSYYDNEVAGRITSRLDRSISTVSQLIQSYANNFIGFFLTSAITLVILAYYAWPVAIMLGLLFPFYIWLTTLSSRTWQAKQQFINVDTDHANGRFVEAVNQIRVVKSFVQEKAERGFFAKRRHDIEKTTYVQSKTWHEYDIYRRLGLNVAFFLIYAYIVYETVKGHYSIGTLTLLITLTQQAQFPLFAASGIVDSLQRARSGSKDYFAIMETKASIQDIADAKPLVVSKAAVSYQHVNFGYNDDQSVLKDISFDIEPGTKVALVGESGEGKTTIANLLLRFYDLGSGTITIDGQDIGQVTQTSLRQNIGVVFQDPALFSGTIRDNIAYGTPNATLDQVEAAAKAANADSFISKMKDKYKTEIGERGVKLSGGQKQRIAIARAILKNAPILILDEATSSLDSRSEHEVQLALEKLMEGRTTLIIAHRLSTIASVDKIISIEGGRIAEQGSPEQLSQSGGLYSQLLELQKAPSSTTKLKRYQLRR